MENVFRTEHPSEGVYLKIKAYIYGEVPIDTNCSFGGGFVISWQNMALRHREWVMV